MLQTNVGNVLPTFVDLSAVKFFFKLYISVSDEFVGHACQIQYVT
jgi:hypothetical protein